MRRAHAVARMAMGGAIWGGLLGLPIGAALGLIVGLCFGHVSWGLDGAVLGVLGLGAGGAIVGAILGLTADEQSLSLTDELALPPRRDSRAAGEPR
jgi:hypothetical protein